MKRNDNTRPPLYYLSSYLSILITDIYDVLMPSKKNRREIVSNTIWAGQYVEPSALAYVFGLLGKGYRWMEIHIVGGDTLERSY